MNKFEFMEVLNEEEISNSYSFIQGRYGEHEDVYYWKDLTIHFGGSFYTVIKGDIPKEVAVKLYELDILGDDYSIRFKGAEKGVDVSLKNLQSVYYHIDTYEGLILFLEVYKQYLNDTIDQDIDISNIVNNVRTNLVKNSRINMSNTEWINNKGIYADTYNQTVDTNNNELLETFRNKIDEYDKAVNPFIGETIDDITDLIDLGNTKVSIYGDFNKSDLIMANKEKQIELQARKNNDGFCYITSFENDNGEIYTCDHYFTKDIEGRCTGEVIKLSKLAYNSDSVSYNFLYNVTNGTFEFSDGHKTAAIMEVDAQIIDELNRYIDKAKELYTIKENGKKLV